MGHAASQWRARWAFEDRWPVPSLLGDILAGRFCPPSLPGPTNGAATCESRSVAHGGAAPPACSCIERDAGVLERNKHKFARSSEEKQKDHREDASSDTEKHKPRGVPGMEKPEPEPSICSD